MISVTMYLNSKGEEKGKRDLYFSCTTEEQRDKWMIAIDYLKTRAIYDAYASKNTLVNFMNPAVEEDTRDREGEERDHGDLLYEFGDQLKSNTMGSRPIKLGGNFGNSVNTSTLRDTINRKSSIFRTNVE